MIGQVQSIQTLGTLDGPGVRCVVFLQGCPLRCAYCHNPNTWDPTGGTPMDSAEILEKVIRCRPYFGKQGGITVSGGEPLLQPAFTGELFELCHRENIHTVLDTSGCILNDDVTAVLHRTDLCMLDVKMTDEASYRQHTGGSLEQTMRFLQVLQDMGIETWIRHVIVPGVNNTTENIRRLNDLLEPFRCISKVELLPFRKMCLEKYEYMHIPFPFADKPEATQAQIKLLSAKLTKPHD